MELFACEIAKCGSCAAEMGVASKIPTFVHMSVDAAPCRA